MALLKLLAVFAVLAVALADDSLALSPADHQKKLKCTKLSLDISATREKCPKTDSKFTSLIRVVIDLPPAAADLVVTLPCTKKGKTKRLSRRVVKCIRVLLKRCRCLDANRKQFCIENQVDDCAGRGVVRPFETPAPSCGNTQSRPRYVQTSAANIYAHN